MPTCRQPAAIGRRPELVSEHSKADREEGLRHRHEHLAAAREQRETRSASSALFTFAVGAAIVVGLGADLLTGITASIACLGNIGPGFGSIGPMASFADLHPISKIVLTLEMWIGRLEVLTVLVLFRFEVWRSAHWSAA